MKNVDLIAMLGNLSRSLLPVQHFFTGIAYLMGILLCLNALYKLRDMAGSTVSSHSSVKSFVPFAYMVAGAALIYLPSALNIFANTAFGVGNILQYSSYNSYNVQSSMQLLIRTAGILWFIRGCILLAYASEPGVQHGSKGFAFIGAGILAINFQNTVNMLTAVMDQLFKLADELRKYQGY